MLNKIAQFIFVTLLSVQSISKELQCQLLFRTVDPVSLSLLAFQNGKQDTTSLRQEVKFVVKTRELNDYLNFLQTHFGHRMTNRDKPLEGTKNITSTNYMNVVKYYAAGKKLSAKFRARKYYRRQLEDVHWRKLKVSSDLENQSWLELKIQHPDYDNVVIKPRLKAYDSDIRWLTTDSFYDHQDGITRRLKLLNPDKHGDVDRFMKFLSELNRTPSMREQGLFAKTEYERISYSIKFKTPDGLSSFDVQITLDENIRLTRLQDKEKYNVYAKDETVIEVKIPLNYSKLSDQNIKDIPDLKQIKDLIMWLQEKHQTKYPMNKGKMSKIEKKHDLDRSVEYEYE